MSVVPSVATAHTPARAGGQRQVQGQTAAVSSSLAQEAGVAPSAVSATRVCSASQPGAASCDAIALRLKSNGSFVHPRVSAESASSAGSARSRRSLSGAVSAASSDTEPGATLEPNSGTPAWLQQAYDTTWLSANRGSGDTVAIVDAYDDPTASADLAVYRSTYGLPSCTQSSGCLTVLNQNGQTQSQAGSWPSPNSSWEGEETLDLDAVSALCPNCHIVLVEANTNSMTNFEAAEASAAAYPGVDQISDSWGATGSGTPSASQFSFPGISVLAASGDSGYELTSGAQYPAAFAGVTAVGGTSLTTGSTSGARGFTETAWTGAGSSCATRVAQPAWQAGDACAGRSTSDLSADADPDTGLLTYGTAVGGWALFGGTSLSTPLTAAFEAITQIPQATTPQWAYTDADQLNDITTGDNDTSADDEGGVCTTALAYLCDAGTGFDGPTGNGSIDGDVATGGPGIGGPDACAPGNCGQAGAGYATSATTSSAQLQAGIYPNGLETSDEWEYGTTTAFGQQTGAATVAAGTMAATTQTTLTGLAAGTTYYYRLVASNADGTLYGYTFSLTTAAAPASTGSTSTTSTSGGSSQTTAVTPPAASGTVTGTVATTTAITSTNATTDPPASGGQTDGADRGSDTKTSAASSSSIALLLSGGRAHAAVGDALSIALPAGAHATAAGETQLLRCLTSCQSVNASGARYTLTEADAGAVMRVRYTPRFGGAYSSAYVGPVLTSTTAGALLGSGRSAVLRTAGGGALAWAHVAVGRPARPGRAVSVTFTRVAHVSGGLRAWICPTALTTAGLPQACTAPIRLSQNATLHTSAAGSFAVVVQRTS